jgi:hypothetical protein
VSSFYFYKPRQRIHLYRLYVGSYVCLLSTRRQGLIPDKEVIGKHLTELSGKLEVYDKILSKQKYLLGDVRQFLPVDT